jgi:GGDEF domain-containing protein
MVGYGLDVNEAAILQPAPPTRVTRKPAAWRPAAAENYFTEIKFFGQSLALEGAVELADRIRAAFAAQRADRGGAVLATTASFGVVGADFGAGLAITPQCLIAVADELMYDAKRGGRNHVRAPAGSSRRTRGVDGTLRR